MNRRALLACAGTVGGVLLAGCVGGGPAPSVPAQGEGSSGDGAEAATVTARRTPTPSETATGTATAEPTPVVDLSAPAVRSTGIGPGTSRRFTALGGPVILSFRYDYSGMDISNFIVRAVDDAGRTLSPTVLHLNELLAPFHNEGTDEYTARLVTHFEPGEYFIDVTHAGGPYGNGGWEVLVEQPGTSTTGRALPVTVDGYDTDVLGPIAFDGPARVSLETFEPRRTFDGKPTTYNYQIRAADGLGRPGERLVNSVGPAPESLSVVWFPGDVDVGYFNVYSFGPWRATVEGA